MTKLVVTDNTPRSVREVKPDTVFLVWKIYTISPFYHLLAVFSNERDAQLFKAQEQRRTQHFPESDEYGFLSEARFTIIEKTLY